MATPSVAMIPSGYKDGTLYNVLPNNAAGDFDVTRGSLATRVNESGLIEPVGTLGADVVLNGDFEETGADQILNGDFSQEGSDVVVNGDFATDSDWSKGAGWTISGSKAIQDGTNGDLQQASLVAGLSYKVTLEVSDYAVGQLVVRLGAANAIGSISANGTYTFYGVASTTLLRFRGQTDFIGSIDNVSVVEVGQEWLLQYSGTGDWDITDKLNFTNVNGGSRQNNVFVIGTTYKITLDYVFTSGTRLILPYDGSNFNSFEMAITTPSSANGYTYYYTPTANTALNIYSDGNGNGSVTNITVEEVGQEWTLTDGCSITAQGARITSDGTSQYIQQTNVLVIGDTYEMEYEITESLSGSIKVSDAFGVETLLKNTVGVHKIYGTAITSRLRIQRTAACDITIDNIKIKRLNGDDTPRIDYTDGGCPVLLTEPQSTNLITHSNDFSASSWTELGSSVSSGFTSPDGSSNAYKSVEDTSNGTHRISGQFGISFVNGETYTFSCFVKKGERNFVHIRTSGITTFGIDSYFDLANGVVGTNSVGTASIENYSNGWYRCSIVGISSNTGGTSINIYSAITDNSNSYQGDGTSGVYIYGAQFEELSYATSLIPTYGAVRTRLQDTVTGAGTSSDFNSEEGVLFAEISVLSDDSTLKSLCINDGTSGNRVIIQYSNASNRLTADVRVGAVGQAFMQTFDYNITDLLRIAIKYKANDFALWVNGLEVATDNSGLTFSANTLSKLSFDAGGTDPLLGKTSQVQVFKTALTDAELQTLTTI